MPIGISVVPGFKCASAIGMTVRVLFGTSTPINDVPKIGASTRTAVASSAIAMSSANCVTLFIRTPLDGLKVYCVTLGPT